MTSRSSNETSSIPHIRLITRAKRIISGQRRSTVREQTIAALLASTAVELDEVRRQASSITDAEQVPESIVRVLRSPRGSDGLAIVDYEGMVIKAVLHPLGRRLPEREAAVWRCLRDAAINVRERRT